MLKQSETILTLPYYTPGSIETESFVMIPSVMLPQPLSENDPNYDPDWDNILSKMSSDEKILYGLMRNRMMGSYMDGNLKRFTDDKGRVFIIMSYEEIMMRMHLGSKSTVKKHLDNMQRIGIIEIESGHNSKTGKNQCSRIYVKDVNAIQKENQVQKMDLENQVQKADPENQVQKSDLETKYTFCANQVQKVDHSYIDNRYIDKTIRDRMADQLKKQVLYDEYLKFIYQKSSKDIADCEIKVADSLIKEMVDIMTTTRAYYKISGDKIPPCRLQSIVMEADINWFIVVVAKLLKWGQGVKDGKAYARAVILSMEKETMNNLDYNAQEYDFFVNDNKGNKIYGR